MVATGGMFALVAAAWFAVALASDAACASDACDAEEAEASALLQGPKVLTQSSQITLSAKLASGQTPSHWQWVHEAFADLTLEDIGCTARPEVGISKQCWQSAFSNLDRDSDGMLSSEELHHAEDKRNAKNLTRKDLQTGLALAIQLYPEESTRLVTNAQLIIAAAFEGIVPPEDAPEPKDPLAAVPKQFLMQQSATRVNASKAIEVYGSRCVEAIVQVAGAAIGIAFGILGIETPSGSLIADAVQTNYRAVNAILDIVRAMDDADDAIKISRDVVDIIGVLYEEGVLTTAVKDSLKSQPWWRWSLMTAQILGTIAAWFASGGTGLAISIALVVMDSVDLIDGVAKVKKDCGR